MTGKWRVSMEVYGVTHTLDVLATCTEALASAQNAQEAFGAYSDDELVDDEVYSIGLRAYTRLDDAAGLVTADEPLARLSPTGDDGFRELHAISQSLTSSDVGDMVNAFRQAGVHVRAAT